MTSVAITDLQYQIARYNFTRKVELYVPQLYLDTRGFLTTGIGYLVTRGYVSAAEKLGISYNTLKFHVRNIYDKLQVHSQSEALAIAMRDRLV
jgi:hypothetical protein